MAQTKLTLLLTVVGKLIGACPLRSLHPCWDLDSLTSLYQLAIQLVLLHKEENDTEV